MAPSPSGGSYLRLIERLLKLSEDREAKPGPVKWCKRCSRKHPARQACKQFLRTRVITRADGTKAKVKRWAA